MANFERSATSASIKSVCWGSSFTRLLCAAWIITPKSSSSPRRPTNARMSRTSPAIRTRRRRGAGLGSTITVKYSPRSPRKTIGFVTRTICRRNCNRPFGAETPPVASFGDTWTISESKVKCFFNQSKSSYYPQRCRKRENCFLTPLTNLRKKLKATVSRLYYTEEGKKNDNKGRKGENCHILAPLCTLWQPWVIRKDRRSMTITILQAKHHFNCPYNKHNCEGTTFWPAEW